MDGAAKTQRGDDINAHAAEGIEEICGMDGSGLTLEGCTKGFYFFDTKALCTANGGLGEGGIQHVLAVLGLGIGEEAEAGSVLVEALVKAGLLVPTVLVVVDVVVSVGVGKVELPRACKRCGTAYLVW
jgi:hypothetical protein